MAPLLETTWDTHVPIEHDNFLVMLPYALLNTLSGRSPASDQNELYPEAFVFGPGEAYTEKLHETPAGARMCGLSEAFAALRVEDWSSFIGDPFAGSSYRCLSDTTAAKFGRFVLEAAVKACDLSADWVPPMKRCSEHSADGAQDGLLKIANRHLWVQITGAEKPSILWGKKAPVTLAEPAGADGCEYPVRAEPADVRLAFLSVSALRGLAGPL